MASRPERRGYEEITYQQHRERVIEKILTYNQLNKFIHINLLFNYLN